MPRSESRSQKNGAKTLQLMTPVQPAEPSDYNSMGILTAPNGGMPPAENEEPEEKEEEEREQDHSDGATAAGGCRERCRWRRRRRHRLGYCKLGRAEKLVWVASPDELSGSPEFAVPQAVSSSSSTPPVGPSPKPPTAAAPVAGPDEFSSSSEFAVAQAVSSSWRRRRRHRRLRLRRRCAPVPALL